MLIGRYDEVFFHKLDSWRYFIHLMASTTQERWEASQLDAEIDDSFKVFMEVLSVNVIFLGLYARTLR